MDYAQLWRIAKTPTILLGLLLFVILAGAWGYWAMMKPPSPPPVAPCVVQPVPDGVLRSEMITVRVLNASNQRGKANEVARQLRVQGFNVTHIGNADEKQDQSVIIGVSPDIPEVQLVAAQFHGFATAGDDRADRTVEVRIGHNYDSMIAEAPTDMPIDTPTICLPAQSAN